MKKLITRPIVMCFIICVTVLAIVEMIFGNPIPQWLGSLWNDVNFKIMGLIF